MRFGVGEDILGINLMLNGVFGRKGGSEGGEGRKISFLVKVGLKGLRGVEECNEGKGGGRGLVFVIIVIVLVLLFVFLFSSIVCCLYEF